MNASVAERLDDLFRQESGRLLAALARILGRANVQLAEDVVQDALVSAMQAWQCGLPDDPRAWIVQVAKNRAVDILRRDRRARPSGEIETEAIEEAFSIEADAENQLRMMFSICDDALSPETHVTLILRLLCGLSAAEIARAFLVDVPTIDRRLHRGRARLQELGELPPVTSPEEVSARQPSVEQALYLLFNEGYHGSDVESPLHPAMCADAIRLTELLLVGRGVRSAPLHALAALFCFHAARLRARLSDDGVVVPLAEQDRSRWDSSLVARGVVHLGQSASGDAWTRWHLEAGIALEHTTAASVEATDWKKIVAYYDALASLCPGPIVALNRALAVTELEGPDAGRPLLDALADEPKLARYSFYWAARADVERRAARPAEAAEFYRRAMAYAKSPAERRSYERRLV
jgi:RNA polymerase sigma-70 factor (ECF subfamily)